MYLKGGFIITNMQTETQLSHLGGGVGRFYPLMYVKTYIYIHIYIYNIGLYQDQGGLRVKFYRGVYQNDDWIYIYI